MNKKTILALTFSLFTAVCFTSCVKDQNCVCTTTTTNLTTGATQTEDPETIQMKDTKKGAKSNCDNLTTTTTFSDEKKETKCEIK